MSVTFWQEIKKTYPHPKIISLYKAAYLYLSNVYKPNKHFPVFRCNWSQIHHLYLTPIWSCLRTIFANLVKGPGYVRGPIQWCPRPHFSIIIHFSFLLYTLITWPVKRMFQQNPPFTTHKYIYYMYINSSCTSTPIAKKNWPTTSNLIEIIRSTIQNNLIVIIIIIIIVSSANNIKINHCYYTFMYFWFRVIYYMYSDPTKRTHPYPSS